MLSLVTGLSVNTLESKISQKLFDFFSCKFLMAVTTAHEGQIKFQKKDKINK